MSGICQVSHIKLNFLTMCKPFLNSVVCEFWTFFPHNAGIIRTDFICDIVQLTSL